MTTYETECSGSTKLVCPYCHAIQRQDDSELCNYDDEHECGKCGQIFEYERECVAYYYSKRK